MPPTCPVCQKGIEGPASNIFGNVYHNSCFGCSACGKDLAGVPCLANGVKLLCVPCGTPSCKGCKKSVLTDGMRVGEEVYHRSCFHCPLCLQSYLDSSGSFSLVNNLPFCSSCSTDLSPAASLEADQELEVASNTCGRCLGPLLPHQTLFNVLDKVYHDSCFACELCESPLPDGRFVDVNGGAACIPCATKQLAPPCHVCKTPIVGQLVTIAADSWHPECLKCTQCNLVLRNLQKIYLKEGSPVCPSCVQPVFNFLTNGRILPSSNMPEKCFSHEEASGDLESLSIELEEPISDSVAPVTIVSDEVVDIQGNEHSKEVEEEEEDGNGEEDVIPVILPPEVPSTAIMAESSPEEVTSSDVVSSQASPEGPLWVRRDRRKSMMPSRTTQTIEEVFSDFRHFLLDDRAVNALLKFMVRDYSVENLLFYLDALQYSELNLSRADRAIYSKRIWEKYFHKDGSMQVDIDQSSFNRVYARMGAPKVTLFAEALEELIDSMEIRAFPRFKRSPEAEELLASYNKK